MHSERQWLAGFGVVLLTAATASAQFRTENTQNNQKNQNKQNTQMRFAEMDGNHDGRITRAEWRGSAQSFNVHDWNNDGVLSGDEVRVGGVRPGDARDGDFNGGDREYTFDDWTARGFSSLDHNRDNRITRDEWHFDMESFRRADHNRDNVISRSEFLNEGTIAYDDDRGDQFTFLDTNNDRRISRAEWHGSRQAFDNLDDNRDGYLSRVEMRGADASPDLFSSMDVNHDGTIRIDEWHWSRQSWDARDTNRDGRLTREEFMGTAAATQLDQRSPAYRAGFDRGTTEGRQAGREDKHASWGYDLEGQRELEQADSGYEPRLGSRAEYQAGYRDGFRRAYPEGFRQGQ